jgi:hypothetical protein
MDKFLRGFQFASSATSSMPRKLLHNLMNNEGESHTLLLAI